MPSDFTYFCKCIQSGVGLVPRRFSLAFQFFHTIRDLIRVLEHPYLWNIVPIPPSKKAVAFDRKRSLLELEPAV